MPYDYKKAGKGHYIVTKKDTGEVVGHTTEQNLKPYLAALHMHEAKRNPKPSKSGHMSFPGEHHALHHAITTALNWATKSTKTNYKSGTGGAVSGPGE